MTLTRRAVLGGVTGSIGAMAGCTDLLGRGGGSDDCQTERVIDEEGTFAPGDTVEVTVDLLANQQLSFEVSRIGGDSDPQAEVLDPDGNQVAETLPDRSISEQIQAEVPGLYVIRIEHGEDAPGEWHIVADVLDPDC